VLVLGKSQLYCKEGVRAAVQGVVHTQLVAQPAPIVQILLPGGKY